MSKSYERPPIDKVVEQVQKYGQVGAAERFGIPRSTIREWLRGQPPENRRKRPEKVSLVERATKAPEEPLGPTPQEEELARKVLAMERGRYKVQAEARAAKKENRVLADEVAKAQSALALVTEVENVPRPSWLVPKKNQRAHHGTLVAAFSDFHIGEAVDPAEMNGYNAYNVEIAEMRCRRFFERTILLSREYLAGVKYDGIVVPNLGDTISGDIHDEFRQTNELSNYEAVPYAVAWFEEGLGMLAEEFGRVHVPCVPGNHPRDSRQPRYKKRSAHNADTLISRLVAQKFKNDDRVTFDIPAGLTADFEVYGTRFRIEHGDEARGGGGIQGAILPLALHTHKARKQAQAEGVPFDILLMGHWHQLLILPAKGFIVNGAGKGYDEYARGKKFEPEPPQQALLVVTPEHGISNYAPLFVGKRSAEGW